MSYEYRKMDQFILQNPRRTVFSVMLKNIFVGIIILVTDERIEKEDQ